ncbi:MAG: FAD-binding protein [Syntrophales bacterium]|nr:FAD-binding protein [Syntrophales bacterium]
MHEQGWRKQLRELATGKVLFDECMDRHTSIGVGGRADALVVPESAVELGRIVALLRAGGVPVFFAGNGTNLIVRDDGFRGAVVSTKGLRTVRLEGRGQDRAAIRAEAGASLAEVVALSAREGLTGLEFCAGIPGSVGGGIRMNAGAYGSEMKDVLESVDLLNGEGNVKTCARAALQFEYRSLALPEGGPRGRRGTNPGNPEDPVGQAPAAVPQCRLRLQEPEGNARGADHRRGGAQGADPRRGPGLRDARQFHREPRQRDGERHHRAHRARAGKSP